MLLHENVYLHLYIRVTVSLRHCCYSLLDDKLLSRAQGSDIMVRCKQLLKALGSLQAAPI